ncbi:MAG: hypothetical protein Q6363_007365, partial [Candidatus Njordarchaeota archaeon]
MLINCAWISDPKTFLRYAIEVVREFLSEDLIERYEKVLEESDLMLVLRKSLELFCNPHLYGKKLVVVLDEFHSFIEKMAYRIARETKKKKAVVKSDILWLLRDI